MRASTKNQPYPNTKMWLRIKHVDSENNHGTCFTNSVQCRNCCEIAISLIEGRSVRARSMSVNACFHQMLEPVIRECAGVQKRG